MVQEVFALYAYAGLCGIYGFIGLCGARLYVGLCIQLSLGVWGHVGLCKILCRTTNTSGWLSRVI